MSGKGSRPRPISVDQATFSTNWDRIFGSKNTVQSEIDAVRRMRDNRSAGEQQEAAWLKNEHYEPDTLICAKCGRDRFKESCGLDSNPAKMIQECPMQGTAHNETT